MDISCLIPTRARPDKLARCVLGLLSQKTEAEFEVLVGVDGQDARAGQCEADAVAAAMASAGHRRVPVHLDAHDHLGPAATRNRLIEQARGKLLLLLNDDVIPAAGLIDAHLCAHDELAARGRSAMVLGSAPWRVHEPDTLFDRLIRETSMVFFYDQMVGDRAADPDHDWGFRHAWTLNLSVEASHVRDVGGFDAALDAPCFEDLELGYRLSVCGLPVVYRPRAIVTHDHRITPGDYLNREQMLGVHAHRLATRSPACAREVFGRDIADGDHIAYSRESIERERRDVERMWASFLEVASERSSMLPASTQAEGQMLMKALYHQHLPVKRWHWRRGLVQAASEALGVRAEALSA